MSFLWRKQRNKQKNKQLTVNHKRPSPKHQHYLFFMKKIFCLSIKRTSLFTFLLRKTTASMTVEAAIVLPMFLFFFLNLSCAIEMIRLHGNLELALWETGNKLSIYGHIFSDNAVEDETDKSSDQSGILQEIGDVAFSYTYVKGQVIAYAGETYLEQSPLMNGAESLQFVETELFNGEDQFEIIMTYAVSPWAKIDGIRPFRMANKYYGHVWNGYEIPGTQESGEADQEVVYLAENGKVYHEDKDCTHLRLTIRKVSILQLPHERNEQGKKYTLCEKCGKGIAPNIVLIGAEGDRYHYREDCSGLKRTVFVLPKEEAADKYRPCSRCSK